MNILFIFTDQQNRYALSCMGNPNLKTPNLDKLAAKGILFDRCYSNDPVCGPFRGTLMTGQYSTTCKVTHNCYPLPQNTPTFASTFNELNYNTSWVGKWHLGGNGNEPITLENQGGFQRFIGYQCYNGFYEDVCFYDKEGNEHKYDRHRTEVTSDLIISELQHLSSEDRPFLLMASYQAPHYPEQPAPEFSELYENKKIIRRPNTQEIDPFTPTYKPFSPRPFEDDPNYQRYGNNLDEYIRLYNAMCTQIDAGIGRILDELDKLGIADETIIFFTSDHGDMQGSHGLKNKCLPYEESAGIPLICYLPNGTKGLKSSAIVSGIDLMPSCLELIGAAVPNSVQGSSFAHLLKGEDKAQPSTVFVESHNPTNWCMIVKNEWKLVAERKDNQLIPYLMFNLADDPYELSNLIEASSANAMRSALFCELVQWNQSIT